MIKTGPHVHRSRYGWGRTPDRGGIQGRLPRGSCKSTSPTTSRAWWCKWGAGGSKPQRHPQRRLSDAQVASDPDWADCEFEEARAHTYHWHGGKGQWRVSHTSVMVCVQKTLFSEGALRNVYQLRQRDATTGMWAQMVAKSFKSACLGGAVTDIKQWHYREVESQVVAKH